MTTIDDSNLAVRQSTGAICIDENGNVAFERVDVLENVKFDYFALRATVYMMIW